MECGAPFATAPESDTADDAAPHIPFQTFTRPAGRPLLGLKLVFLLVALALLVASVKALRRKAAQELLQEQLEQQIEAQTGGRVSSKKGPPGFVMIDVGPGKESPKNSQ